MQKDITFLARQRLKDVRAAVSLHSSLAALLGFSVAASEAQAVHFQDILLSSPLTTLVTYSDAEEAGGKQSIKAQEGLQHVHPTVNFLSKFPSRHRIEPCSRLIQAKLASVNRQGGFTIGHSVVNLWLIQSNLKRLNCCCIGSSHTVNQWVAMCVCFG